VMLHAGRVAAEWLPIVAALVVSTAVALAATALTFRALVRWQEARTSGAKSSQ